MNSTAPAAIRGGLDQLMEQVHAILRSVWTRRWLAAGVAWGCAVVFAALVWLIPERYQASARIYVDTQTVLKPLMQGLAFQPDLDQQVRMLARTLVSRPNVERLVGIPELRLTAENQRERELLVESLMRKIMVTPVGGGNLYEITYRDPDAQRARQLVGTLVHLFVDSGQDTKRRDSQEASRFIDQQIAEYEGKLVTAENQLKDFKLRNFGVIGSTDQSYSARMAQLTDEVGRLVVQLQAAEQGRDALKRELSAEQPQLPPELLAQAPVVVTAVTELDARLDAQRRQLDELLRRYTEDHPDVVATRRTIVQLETQRQVENDRRNRLLAERGRAAQAANNPVFQRLRIALAEAEANVASIRSQLNAQQARLDQTRAMASRVPQVEAELAQLNRDYDVIKRNYDQLVSRREAANLGVKIDESMNMADFRIIEPARVSPTPVFPSRMLLAIVAMLLAALIGVAVAYGMSLVTPAVSAAASLAALTGRPVIGTVSRVVDLTTEASRRRDLQLFVATVVVFLMIHAVWVVTVPTLSRP